MSQSWLQGFTLLFWNHSDQKNKLTYNINTLAEKKNLELLFSLCVLFFSDTDDEELNRLTEAAVSGYSIIQTSGSTSKPFFCHSSSTAGNINIYRLYPESWCALYSNAPEKSHNLHKALSLTLLGIVLATLKCMMSVYLYSVWVMQQNFIKPGCWAVKGYVSHSDLKSISLLLLPSQGKWGSHTKMTGGCLLEILIWIPKRYQDPSLWVWLEMFSTPKRYQF